MKFGFWLNVFFAALNFYFFIFWSHLAVNLAAGLFSAYVAAKIWRSR